MMSETARYLVQDVTKLVHRAIAPQEDASSCCKDCGIAREAATAIRQIQNKLLAKNINFKDTVLTLANESDEAELTRLFKVAEMMGVTQPQPASPTKPVPPTELLDVQSVEAAQDAVAQWWSARFDSTQSVTHPADALRDLEAKLGPTAVKKRLQRWWRTVEPAGRIVFHETGKAAGGLSWQTGKRKALA